MATGIGIGTSQSLRRILTTGTGPVGPINTVPPEIDSDGSLLNLVSNGTWTNITGTVTYTYQWYRNGVAIVGETNDTYAIQVADSNKNLKLKVTATDDVGSGYAFSNTISIGYLWGANTISQIWGSLTNLIWGS